MDILWISWKDKQNPRAGGAETVTDQLLKRLSTDGHSVTLLCAGFAGARAAEQYNGYRIVRLGNHLSIYSRVRQYLKLQKSHGKAYDLVVEEINTLPFFARSSVKTKKYFLFFHQLARQVWWHEVSFPLSLVGFLAEPLYLWLLRKLPAITVSESTKRDLRHFGFADQSIHIISEGIPITPLDSLEKVAKFPQPTLLSLGALRSMKRTIDQVRAFEEAKKILPNLKLIIAGPSHTHYGQKVMNYVKASDYRSDIEVLGPVSRDKKVELLRRSHLLLVTSVKEGWGLVVTEANSQGTLAIVYDVDGLRDSVRDGITGVVVTKNNPQIMAQAVVKLLDDEPAYQRLRRNAWAWSKQMTFDKCYADFLLAIRE